MAIYHAHFSYISRAGTGSVASHAAYISGSIVKEERVKNDPWDYTKHAKDVLLTGIIAPEGAPDWVNDPSNLWKEVEAFEDYIAYKRFKGHKDPEKNSKSLAARKKFLEKCVTGYKATVALPIEIIDKNHLIELSQKITQDCYVSHGLVAQYGIHDKKGNPHLHILAATRPLVDGAFSKKRHRIEQPEYKELRKQIADIINQFGQEKGYDYCVDHRSYKDQNIKLVATKHLGPNARHRLQELSRNVQENEEIRQKNVEILLEHPEEIIKVVASQKAVFTQVDLCREIFKRVGGDEKLYRILKAKVDGLEIPSIAIIGKTLNDNHIYESKSIQFDREDYSRTIESFTAQLLSQEHAIYLGENVKGQAFYTSKEMKNLETSIAEKIDILKSRKFDLIKERYKLSSIENIQKEEGILFSEEQRGAIDHLLSNTAISVLTGKAGTGKSTVLKPVVEAYKQSGFTVIGTSFQGKVADQLSNELDIEGYTLDQLKKRWEDHDKNKRLIEHKEVKGLALAKAKAEMERLQKWRLTEKHVVILDEGSMVHGALWKSLLQEVERSGAQLRIVQDNKQIKALHGLDAARLVEEKVGAYEIKSVVRQKEQWMREASVHLNEHRIEDGLKPYYERGHFDFRERDFEAKISLVADYLEGIGKTPHQTHMILAQKNKDVIEMNELLREALMSQGKLGDEFIFGQEGEGILNTRQPVQGPKTQHFRKSAYGRRFAIGDHVMFLENDHKERHVQTLEKGKNDRVGVKNGTLGVIESFNLKRQTVEVRLHDGRLVGFDSKSYDALIHGYAVTINKSQGATFDHSYGFFSSFNSNQLLIWLTRHKETFKGYVSKGIASDLKSMVSHIAKSDYKGLSTDYDLSAEQKPYFNLVQHYWKIAQEVGNLKTKIDALTLQAEQVGKEISLTKEWAQYNDLVQTRNKDATEILKNWNQCSPFMYQTGVRRDALEVQVGIRPRLLSLPEQAALDLVETYFEVAHQTRKLWKDISHTHPGVLSQNHPDYESYAKVKAERNELAYSITSFPEIHKTFFKVKEQEGTYVTYQGTVYEERPQGFKTAQEQAKQYILEKRAERYESQLTFNERVVYKQIQDYRTLHHQAVAAFHHLKELEKTASISSVIETHQQKAKYFAKNRDLLAYQIIENYSIAQPFIERLGLKEENILKHAVYGEVRQVVEFYRNATTVEDKAHLAEQLLSFALKEEGGVDKPIYGLLKEQGLDLQKLKFEKGWAQTQEGHSLSLNELEAIYQNLSDYRSLHKEVAKEWEIIQTTATQKVVHIQEEQIKALNLLGTTNRLERASLEEEAFSALKLKASNPQALAYINNQIRLTVNGVGQWSDLKDEIQGRQVELNHLHTSLQKGRSGYVEIYARNGGMSSWGLARSQKLEKAKSLFKNYGPLHQVIQNQEYDRLFKEAHEQEMTDLVRQFKDASYEMRPQLAQEIQGWLSLEQDERLTYTLTALKQEKVSVDSLQLFEKVLTFPKEKQSEFSYRVHTYITAKQEFSDIWQRYIQEADLRLAEEKINLQDETLALEAKLHSKNAKYNPHYFVERTLQRTAHALKEAKFTNNDLISLEQGLGNEPQHEIKQEIEGKIGTWVERGSQTYGWTLSSHDKDDIKKDILILAIKQNELFEKKLDAISKIIKEEEHKIPPYALAAGKRNKAAFELVNSGFIATNDYDYMLTHVKDHALRYACSSSRLEKIYVQDPEKFKDHKVVLFLKDQLVHGDADKQTRIQETFERAGLTLDGKLIEERIHRDKRDIKDQKETKRSSQSKINQPAYYDKEEILSRLSNSQVEEIYARYIDLWVSSPKPSYSSKEIRYAPRGGFIVYRHTRTWYNHGSDEGGDIFNYVGRALNISYGEAIKHIGREINAPQLTQINWEERARRESELKLQAEIEERVKIERSQENTKKLYEGSQPIEGTIAERYLREHRKIKTAELPEDLRFIPDYKDYDKSKAHPVLVSFSRNHEGRLTAHQLIYLDPITSNKADVAVKKKSKGTIKGTTVEIQKGQGLTYVAEGIETALSLKEAGANGRIVASLGLSNMNNISAHLKKDELVILCADADDPQSSAWKTSERALAKLQQEGFKVSIIRPQGVKGRDFNDVLKEENVEAVRTYFEQDKAFTGFKSKKLPLESEAPGPWNEFSQDNSLTSQEEVFINNETLKGSQNQEYKSLEEKVVLPSDWQEEFKREYLRKNPEAALRNTETNEKAAKSLTSYEVIHKYKSLTWKLENVSSGSILKDAQKEFSEMISKASQDKALMRQILLEDKKIAQEISTHAEQQNKVLKRDITFER